MKVRVCMVREPKPDFFSRLIMSMLGCNYSHAMILYKGICYHAIEKGVVIEPLAEALHDGSLIECEKELELKCTEAEFFAFMKGAEGKDYSETQLLGFVFPFLKKYVSDGRRELICSEFVCWALKELGGYDFGEDLDYVDPKELWEKISSIANSN